MSIEGVEDLGMLGFGNQRSTALRSVTGRRPVRIVEVDALLSEHGYN